MAESRQTQHHHQHWINRVWYGRSLISWLLLPLSGLYWLVIWLRKIMFKYFTGGPKKFEVPLIVVGNITVGGTGKTPMVVYLCEELKKLGYTPGVASRGYGGSTRSLAVVTSFHDAGQVGDEPVLIYDRTGVPVAVGDNRLEVIDHLIRTQNCNVVVCDDGLQDYRFVRDIEIIMVDGERRFGNKRLLPAGPLREPINRIFQSEFRVVTGRPNSAISEDSMQFDVDDLCALNERNKTMPLDTMKGQTVHALAGIANPQRFFELLSAKGLNVIGHAYEDHAVFSLEDLQFPDDFPVLMTEKDAVKCRMFELDNVWYLPITARLPNSFVPRVQNYLREKNG